MATETSTKIPEKNISLVQNPKDHTLSVKEVPFTLSPGHHVIKVAATALTSGELFWQEPLTLPNPVPGFDIAGTILNEITGSPFKPGDRVYASNQPYRPGAARQFTEAPPAELALVPANLSWEETASTPLSALTAWQALFTHAGLDAPDQSPARDLPAPLGGGGGSGDGRRGGRPLRVLVTAASGGVGVWTVQLAKLAGAYVVATCGTGNVDVVRGLGADEVLDYRKTDIAAWVAEDRQREFDIVIDCVGKKVLEECWTVVKEGGFLNSVAEPADGKRPAEGVAANVRSLWFIVEPVGEQLKAITRLIEDGKCKPALDSAWDFDDYEQAFARVNGGHVTGKVVLRAPRT